MAWIQGVMEAYGYLGIIFVIALENLFPPIPSELILPLAGYLTTKGALSVFGVVVAATIGSVIGALILYAIGWYVGRKRLYEVINRYAKYLKISDKALASSEYWFSKYGPITVFLCRMLPVIRSLISIPAGLAGMNVLIFIIYTAAGTLIWNALLVMAGAFLGAAWSLMAVWISYYQHIIYILFVLLLAIWLIFRFIPKKSKCRRCND